MRPGEFSNLSRWLTVVSMKLRSLLLNQIHVLSPHHTASHYSYYRPDSFFWDPWVPEFPKSGNFLVHRRGLCSRVWHSKFVFFCLSSYAATNTSPMVGIYLIQLIYPFSVGQSVNLDEVKANNTGPWVKGLKIVLRWKASCTKRKLAIQPTGQALYSSHSSEYGRPKDVDCSELLPTFCWPLCQTWTLSWGCQSISK